MIDLRDFTKRKTGFALSALTSLVLILGYTVVQWLEGVWQPSALEVTHVAPIENNPPMNQQPLVLQPSVPDGAITTGWEPPVDETPIDTASREREIR